MTLKSEENPENLTISIWFVCRSCEFTFPFSTVDQFLDHKKMEHFSELEKTQSIVFEERKQYELNELSRNTNDEDAETKLFPDDDDDSQIDIELCSSAKAHGIFSSVAETSTTIPAPVSVSMKPVHEIKPESPHSPSLITSHTNAAIEAIETAAAAPGQVIERESNAEFSLFSIRSFSPDNNSDHLSDPDLEADQQPHGSTTTNIRENETHLVEPNNLTAFSSENLITTFPSGDDAVDAVPDEAEAEGVADDVNVDIDADNYDVKYVPDDWNSETPEKNPYVLIRRLTSKEILLSTTNLRTRYNRKCKNQLTHRKKKTGKSWKPTSTKEKRFKLKLKRPKLKHSKRKQPKNDEQIFMCDICGKSFSRNYRLKDHLLTHGEVRSVQCTHPNCSKAFKSRSNLSSHLQSHNDSKLFTCPKEGCSSPGFKTKADLTKHLKLSVIHNGVPRPKPWRCDSCDKLFGKKVGLDQHMISAHGFIAPIPLRPFECQFCKKSFPSKNRLNTHWRKTHSEDRPFKCTYDGCDKAYKDKNTLTEHVNGKHTGERPYQCDSCGKSFYILWSFKLHLKMHKK